MSASWISSSASRGCSGKDAGFVLQVFMAQVRKLRVRSFMVGNVFVNVSPVVCIGLPAYRGWWWKSRAKLWDSECIARATNFGDGVGKRR